LGWSFQATFPAIAFCILFDKLLNAVVKHYVVGLPPKSSAFTARLSETLHWHKNLWASSSRQPTTNTDILSTLWLSKLSAAHPINTDSSQNLQKGSNLKRAEETTV
jgi:hypothetical protein